MYFERFHCCIERLFKFPQYLGCGVSQTFSADQLYFRNVSVLIQRWSLPENFWAALIQLWTVLKLKIFRAKNQRSFPLIHNWAELISDGYRMITFAYFHFFSRNFLKHLNFEKYFLLSVPFLKKWTTKFKFFNFLTGQRYNKNLNF